MKEADRVCGCSGWVKYVGKCWCSGWVKYVGAVVG